MQRSNDNSLGAELCEKQFRIVSREELVSSYVGQTAVKTRKLLEECTGSVIFIDEAYSLCHDNDRFVIVDNTYDLEEEDDKILQIVELVDK